MYYIIYKITNLINNKIYIGQHVSRTVMDNYMGSGTLLRESFIKYGKTNFVRENLFIFDTFAEMNDKEIELVTEEFVMLKTNYNIVAGGKGAFSEGSVVAKLPSDKKYKLISNEDFLNNKHYCTPRKGTLIVNDGIDKWKSIPSIQYGNLIHTVPSTGYVSVYDNVTGESCRILLINFDKNKYTKVFGGIVSEIDGDIKYVSKAEFDMFNLDGIHKGNVTVTHIDSGVTKHVSILEFNANRQLYRTNAEGYATGRHKITGEKRRFLSSEVSLWKHEYNFSTSGNVTIFDVILGKFKNIPTTEYDRNIHHKSSDKKFTYISKTGEIICKFWGGKKLFLDKNNYPEKLWSCLINKTVYNTKDERYKHLNGSYFNEINWRKEYGI